MRWRDAVVGIGGAPSQMPSSMSRLSTVGIVARWSNRAESVSLGVVVIDSRREHSDAPWVSFLCDYEGRDGLARIR